MLFAWYWAFSSKVFTSSLGVTTSSQWLLLHPVPTPPPPRLSTALPHTRLGSQNCLPSVPLGRRAQFPWRGARIPSEEGCLSSPMCSLGWSYQAPLPIYSVVLSNSSLLPQHHRREMDGPRKDSVYKVKCKSKNIES